MSKETIEIIFRSEETDEIITSFELDKEIYELIEKQAQQKNKEMDKYMVELLMDYIEKNYSGEKEIEKGESSE